MIPKKTIENIRYGVATNSSSTHSIIHNTNSNTKDMWIEGDGYGWEDFICSSKEEKNKYLNTQLLMNVQNESRNLLNYLLLDENYDKAAERLETYIDHQSVVTLPVDKYGHKDLSFFKDWKNYIINNDFLILGGNDNSEGHPLRSEDDGKKDSFFSELEHFSSVDRCYKNGNYWVLIDSLRKLRVNFTNEEIKNTQPELIDLKITDFCDVGCSFCYQGSTKEGIHADFENVRKAIKMVTVGNVITEFAIGGGEPTTHPKFINILKEINTRKGIANFTTKSKKWFKESEIVQAVKEYVTGLAYSIDTAEEFQEFLDLHAKAFFSDNSQPWGSPEGPKIYIHLIPEIMSTEDFREILGLVEQYNLSEGRGRYVTITILGFKQLGRAQNIERQLQPEIIDIFMELKHTPIGIDTKFAHDYQEYLDSKNIDRRLYTTEEGQFSMYIDAVKERAYRSSYELDYPVDYNKIHYGGYKKIIEVFSKINQNTEGEKNV